MTTNESSKPIPENKATGTKSLASVLLTGSTFVATVMSPLPKTLKYAYLVFSASVSTMVLDLAAARGKKYAVGLEKTCPGGGLLLGP